MAIASLCRGQRGNRLPARGPFGLVVFGLCSALVGRLVAQEVSSLKNLDLNAAKQQISRAELLTENRFLKDQLSDAKNSLNSLQQSFGVVTTEAEVFRRKVVELTSRIESMGSGQIESRLINLLNELKLARNEKTKLRESLIQLTDAVQELRKADSSNENLELAVKDAEVVLGVGQDAERFPHAVGSTLTDAIIVSSKQDLALLVVNVGSQQGVKLGMPFNVVRDREVLATIRVVDVRERVSGALVQNLSKGQEIKVGDHARVVAN